MTSKRLAVLALFSAIFILPCAVEAIGLGDIRVISSLGDRFRAEIPILNSSATIEPGCFHMSTDSPDAIGELPWLVDAQIALVSAPQRLIISTRRPVDDPAIQLAIFTGCGSFLTRYFTVLLSPPVERSDALPVVTRTPSGAVETPPKFLVEKPVKAAQGAVKNANVRSALPGETSIDMARRLYPRQPRAQKRFVREMIALNTDWISSASGDETLPEGVELNYPPPVPSVRPKEANRSATTAKTPAQTPIQNPVAPLATAVAAAADKTEPIPGGKDRLVIASDEPMPTDSLSARATPEEIDKRLGDVKSQVGTMRAELGALRAKYPAPPPAIQTALVEMEARLLGVELSITRISLANLAPEVPAAAPLPEPVMQADAVVDESATPPTIPASEPALKPNTPVAKVETTQAFDTSLVLLGIFGLGIGLSFLLYLRTKRRDGRAISGGAPSSITSAEDTIQPDVEPPESPTQPMAPETLPPSGEIVETQPEADQPIELAEILLVYGRTQGAIEVFLEHINRNPKESLQPSLRLLEVYKQADMRREFEVLAAQLTHHFNIERVLWDETLPALSSAAGKSADENHVPNLFGKVPPHIRSQVASNWGTRECLDFLRKLLDDNREGTRKGFPVSVTYAILGLIKSMEDELKIK